MTKQLSLIIPSYNEAQNIPILLERLAEALKDFNKEVIVVDDDSPDKTWEIARNLSHKYPWLKVIRRIHEKGLSSAVLAGFAVAEGDYLAVIDADLQHDESILPKFFLAFEKGADVVIGSRKVEGGSVENWSPIRKFISFVATIMAKIALRHAVTDPMSGFFAIKKEIYSSYKDKINPRGFKILIEFIARAHKVHIEEVGYVFRGRIHGESKLSHKVIFDYIKTLYELSVGQFIPLTFLMYCLVGLSGLFVSAFFLFLGLKVFHLGEVHALWLSIEASVLTNFIFNNCWTFKNKRLKTTQTFLRGLLTFHAICLGGALINQAVALKLSGFSYFNLYLANAVGYSLAAIWNYAMNINVTWKS